MTSYKTQKRADHFAFSFTTKNINNVLSFQFYLLDSKNEQIEFINGEKKKTFCLKLTLGKKDNQISQYNKIFKATKIEYQKLFNKNKSLNEENKKYRHQQQQQHQQQLRQQLQQQNSNKGRFHRTKRRYKTDSDSELETEDREIIESDDSKDKKPKKEKYKKKTNK